MGYHMLLTQAALGTALLASVPQVAGQTPDPVAPYYGNTFISLHDDGTQFIVYWNADKSFSLARVGGAQPDAAYVINGTYTLTGGSACFHVAGPPPPGSPKCVPFETGVVAGTVWEVHGSEHELHMIVAGRSSLSLAARVSAAVPSLINR